MMNRTHIRFACVIAAALVGNGCGSDSKSADTTAPPPSATPATTANIGFTFSTGSFVVQPGDTFECFYTDTITAKQLNVNNATAKQGKGGHHVTVYYTDQKVPVGHHPCANVEMVGFHEVAGAANGSEGIIPLPAGYATKVPQGKQLVIQSHYISTSTVPTTVEDVVSLETIEDADVKQFANAFVISDGSFSLAPRAMGTSTTDCIVPQDFDVMLMLGHMHELGMHYKLERLDAAGKPSEMLYQTDWDPSFVSHPPVTKFDPSKPMKFKKGQTLRQTCEWKNTSDAMKAFPDEMCVMFSYYAPDVGFITCDVKVVK